MQRAEGRMSGETIKRREFTAGADSAGIRVDKYITTELGEGASRSYVKFLMDNGFARLNGGPVKPHRSVREGDNISLELVPLPEETDMEPENIPLK
ncbi:MAG: RNA pseudouridine synthase, partial [Candidatus Omnitrophota bacterium]